jgi:hypothetical protein
MNAASQLTLAVPPGAATAANPVRAEDGRATAITVMTPIKPGGTSLERLVLFLADHVKMLNEALDELAFIHYARWTIITGLPYNGAPQEREKLHYDYLLFETNFNGTWDDYIEAFSEVLPERMNAIWGTSFGFPGPQPAGPFKAYIHRNDLPIAHYYAAYPDGTTKTVRSALAVARRLAEFREEAAHLTDPEEFRRWYDAFLTDIQHDL